MAQIVILRIGACCAQVDLGERDGCTLRVDAIILYVGAPSHQHRILKQGIGGAVLLEDDDHVRACWRACDGLTSAAAIQAQQKSGKTE
jgi:hypothetical protein